MTNKNKLYNVVFPLWMLLVYPPAWLVVLPANFVVDSLVLLLAAAVLKLDNKKELYKKSILRIWLLGFAADLVGAAVLIGVYALLMLLTAGNTVNGGWLFDNVAHGFMLDPFSGVLPFLLTLLGVAVAGLCIYQFNRRISFRRLEMEESVKSKLALTLALCTAPYLFFIPARLFF